MACRGSWQDPHLSRRASTVRLVISMYFSLIPISPILAFHRSISPFSFPPAYRVAQCVTTFQNDAIRTTRTTRLLATIECKSRPNFLFPVQHVATNSTCLPVRTTLGCCRAFDPLLSLSERGAGSRRGTHGGEKIEQVMYCRPSTCPVGNQQQREPGSVALFARGTGQQTVDDRTDILGFGT